MYIYIYVYVCIYIYRERDVIYYKLCLFRGSAPKRGRYSSIVCPSMRLVLQTHPIRERW